MKKTKKTESEIIDVATKTLDEIESASKIAGEQVDEVVLPIRKGILKRFPVLFLLAVTFGFTAVITSIELLIVQSEFLTDHPMIILGLGLGTLVLTGTLYKKLG